MGIVMRVVEILSACDVTDESLDVCGEYAVLGSPYDLDYQTNQLLQKYLPQAQDSMSKAYAAAAMIEATCGALEDRELILKHSISSELTSEGFRDLCVIYLRQMGFHDIQYKNDSGVDLIVYRNGLKYVIMCRYDTSIVPRAAVGVIRLGCEIYEGDYAVMMTNSTCSQGALDEAVKCGVQIWGLEIS